MGFFMTAAITFSSGRSQVTRGRAGGKMWGEVEIVRSALDNAPQIARRHRVPGGGVWCQVLAQLFAQRPSLGAPRRLSTPMPRPFAYVCQPPTPGTPAAAAGLALGDLRVPPLTV